MVALELAQDEMVRRGKVVEGLIALERPELINLFLTYQNEAVAGRKFLEKSLVELDIGTEILEVGGGILALAIQLASEGFKVTTVEPVGEGFSDILLIMSLYQEIARNENLDFTLIKSPIENCRFHSKFDFIFSINVMEHLHNPYSTLLQMVETLKPKGRYRFFCPNYDFPYEPHFGKWLISRSNKAFFLPKHRASSHLIPENEASGLYSSINFLTLKKLKGSVKGTEIRLSANRNSLYEVICRSIHDSELEKRHKGLASFTRFLFVLKLHYLARFLPAIYQPIMDVEATLVSD
jgi:2-polyprenyl-3-methyl-5-hydroxy-6-metoxy-1,4-benzoquinol methylase